MSRGRTGWPGAGLLVAGVLVAGIALSPPFEARADADLPTHMVQHVLLTMVAVSAVAAGLGRAPRLGGVPAWLAFAATGWAVHFSPFFDAAADHVAVHVAEHMLLAGTALLFWAPVVGPVTTIAHPLRILYVVMAMPQNTFLALAIYSADHVLYPHYGAAADAMGDQRLAGGIMWVAGDLVLLGAVVLLAAGWARHEERQNSLIEGADQPPSPRTGG